MKFERKRDLAELKATLTQRINERAQIERDQILTPGVPYAEKREQALLGEGPYIELEMSLRGCSASEACSIILDAADVCDAAMMAIETTRLTLKAAVAAATTNDAARSAAIWPS